MRKALYAFLTIISFCTSSYAQGSGTKNKKILNVLLLPSGREKIVLDLLISPFETDRLTVLSTTEIKSRFPEYKDGNVLIVKPKKGIVYIGLDEILDEYKVKTAHRNYTILFEDSLLQSPKTLIASKAYINGVKVDPDKKTLNIISTLYEKSTDFRKKMQAMPADKKIGGVIFD